MNATIPVTILTGFLGSGKTTLLNHILHADHGLRVAVLVNDFGEVNIDSQLILGVEGETISLANGCICCTMRGELQKIVLNLLERPEPPEYILIETSGVSDPKAVVVTLMLSQQLSKAIHVDSVLTMVDCEQIRSLFDEQSRLAKSQIDVADIVVLNKIDLVSSQDLVALQAWIREIVPQARIIETQYGQVPLELVLGLNSGSKQIEIETRSALDVHVHDADEVSTHDHDHSLVFHSWSYTTDKPLSLEAVQKVARNLPPTIFRAKGILYLADQPERRAILQVVGRRVNIELEDALWGEQDPHTQIVIIGASGGVDVATLRERFEQCWVKKAISYQPSAVS